MGLTLQFAIGDKDEIIDAVAYEDFELLGKLESEKLVADFSFHFVPDDLNPLIKIVGRHLILK